MRKRYQGLVFAGDHPEPSTGTSNFFGMMSAGELFRLHPIIDFKHGSDDPAVIDEEAEMLVKILSVRTDVRKRGLTIEFKTCEVPDGMQQGQFILEFDDYLVCDNLPVVMFAKE